jgi:UDP-N-acetylmuramyl pentapeptide phosphotransferase/UDP-N-acetylglucosamine-1-phosphate transferase
MPQDELVLAIAVVAGCAGLTFALILVLKPLLVRYLLARPNARSSHNVATPQGAGAAVTLSMLVVCGAAFLLWPYSNGQPALAPVLAAAAALAVLGALDDAHALSVSWRLIGQILAAVAVVLWLPEDFRLLPDILPLAVERVLLVLGAVGLVNVVNFLDGIDWMTVAEVVPMTLGIAILQVMGAVPGDVGLLALALLGSMLGFAVLNKHPARVFLGDAGSLPVGLYLAWMLIFVAKADLVAALLLPLYTVADATITLLRRLIEKEPIFSAHRSHFYQRAVARGFSVPQVTARVFMLGLVLAALAIAAALARSPVADVLLLIAGALATGFLLHSLARGRR